MQKRLEITAEVNAEESEAVATAGQPEQTETGAEKKTNGNAVGEAEQTRNGCRSDGAAGRGAGRGVAERFGGWHGRFCGTALPDCAGTAQSDAAGKADWIQLLKSGEASGSEVARPDFLQAANIGKSGKMDAAYVEDLYQAILGRTYDEAGKQSWISLLESGVSRTGILLRIYRFAGIYGTLPQLWNYMRQFCLGGARRMFECKGDGLCAAELCREVLGRDGDANGLNDWTRLLFERGGDWRGAGG